MSVRDGVRMRLTAAAWRCALLALGWWALLDGEGGGVAFGALFVLAAAAASLSASPPASATRLRPLGLARLAIFFLTGSLRGGWDVARRALAPRLAISPTILEHRTALDTKAARTVFASLTTLMPGTLSLEAHGRDVRIHVLADRGDAMHRELRVLEDLVAAAIVGRTPENEVPHA